MLNTEGFFFITNSLIIIYVVLILWKERSHYGTLFLDHVFKIIIPEINNHIEFCDFFLH